MILQVILSRKCITNDFIGEIHLLMTITFFFSQQILTLVTIMILQKKNEGKNKIKWNKERGDPRLQFKVIYNDKRRSLQLVACISQCKYDK